MSEELTARDHLDVGPVTLVTNGEVHTISGSTVHLSPNNWLFASRIDLVVFDPVLETYEILQGDPAYWRPRVPDRDSRLPLGMMTRPSRWRRFRLAVCRAIAHLFWEP